MTQKGVHRADCCGYADAYLVKPSTCRWLVDARDEEECAGILPLLLPPPPPPPPPHVLLLSRRCWCWSWLLLTSG